MDKYINMCVYILYIFKQCIPFNNIIALISHQFHNSRPQANPSPFKLNKVI